MKKRYLLSSKYNKIYEKLVSDEFDYTGMIAYCIYKSEKRKWILCGYNSDDFVKLKLMAHELSKYKLAANELLTKAYQANTDEEIEKIKKILAKEMVNTACKSLNSSRKDSFFAWHNSGAAGIFGNFYTGAVIAIGVWIFSSSETWKAACNSAKTFICHFFY